MGLYATFFGPPKTKIQNIREHIHTDKHGYTWVDKDFFGFNDLSTTKDIVGLNLPTAHDYLYRHGREYPWRQLWLGHGRYFKAPSRESCVKIQEQDGFVNSNCYNLCLTLAIGPKSRIIWPTFPHTIQYAEGLVVHPTGPYLHSWLLVDGKVYDPKYADGYRVDYFGVAFDPQFILNFAESTNKVSLLQNWIKAEHRVRQLLGK